MTIIFKSNLPIVEKEVVKTTETMTTKVTELGSLLVGTYMVKNNEVVETLPYGFLLKDKPVFLTTAKMETHYHDSGRKSYSTVQKLFKASMVDDVLELTFLGKERRKTLTINPDGKMSVTQNGKLVTDRKKIQSLLYKITELFDLDDISYEDYLHSRSPKVRSMNWNRMCVNTYYRLDLPERNKVYRLVAQNKTREATALLLTGSVKASKKLVSTLSGMSFCRDRGPISRGFSKCDANTWSQFVVNVYNTKQRVSCNLLIDLASTYPNAWKSIIANSKTREGATLLADTRRMLQHNTEAISEMTSIRAIHDSLVIRQNALRDIGDGIERLPTLNKLPNFYKDGYKVVSVNAHDLPELGRKLRICVGSYKNMCWLGKVNISAVYKDREPVACLEWYNNHLVQAKLSCNKRPGNGSDIYSVIVEWCSVNVITIATADMDGYSNIGVQQPEALEERMELLMKASKGRPDAYVDDMFNPLF